jgi:hypothetical protein
VSKRLFRGTREIEEGKLRKESDINLQRDKSLESSLKVSE